MNLIEALETRGIEYREHQSKDNEISICCPFCMENGTTPDTRFRLGINVVTGWMFCFNGGCGKASRDADYTWKELQRVLDTGQLEAAANVVKKKKRVGDIRLPADFEPLSKNTTEYWGKKAYQYLRSRGIPDWQIEERKIGYSLIEEFRYRIIFPVEYRGKLHGLVGRAFIEDLEPRYKNSIGEKTLYGLPDRVVFRDALLVEGVVDCLSMDRAVRAFRSFNVDVAATLSTSISRKQLDQLKDYESITVWFDPDATGLMGTQKAVKKFLEAEKQVWVVMPTVKGNRLENRDTGEMSVDEIWSKWRRKRVEYSEDVERRFKMLRAFVEED